MFKYHSNYLKVHNYKLKKKKKKIRNLTLGTFGLQSNSYGIITTNQFKSIKRITLRVLKPFKGHIWLKCIPDISITSKPKDIRMGKGVGKIDYWLNVINPLDIVIELDNVPVQKSSKLIKIILTRISIKVNIISNQSYLL